MLRSEKMTSVAVYFSGDNIKDVLTRIGDRGILEFQDLNQIDNVCLKNIDKLEQRLHSIHESIEYVNPKLVMSFEKTSLEINNFYEIKTEVLNRQKDLLDKLLITEETICVKKEWNMFAERVKDASGLESVFVLGIIDMAKKFILKDIIETLLNKYVHIEIIDCDEMKYCGKRSVFIIYSLERDYGKKKLMDVIAALGGRAYEPESLDASFTAKNMHEFRELESMLNKVRTQIEDSNSKIKEFYNVWKIALLKEKKLHQTVNMLIKHSDKEIYSSIDEIKDEIFTGKCWIKSKDLHALDSFVSYEKEGRFWFSEIQSDNLQNTESLVPTAFNHNKYTEAFQNLTNVFGVPRYQEINPAIFMLVTFPFLFGSMFGDIFHGLILMLISFIMIKNFDVLNNNCGVLQILLEGRYVIFMCSISAIWFGFLYNEFGSQPIFLFNSSQSFGTKTYPFGIDPVWHHAENSMIFTNNVKMKLSLIIGFIHMELGLLISIFNAIYFNNMLDLFCIIIPQFVSFTLFLGYLVFLCVYKWLVTIDHPSLVSVLIKMYTEPFAITEEMYPYQFYVQIFILATILVSVPWMLFAKPLYIYILGTNKSEDGMLNLWINSGIHTIEFLLGLISNTASYLRIWAVCLAHMQLTSVMHQFTIANPSIYKKVVFFPIYIIATFLILIFLEGLSACLHALRLNWIEFFSKFYRGDGRLFKPLSFEITREELNEE